MKINLPLKTGLLLCCCCYACSMFAQSGTTDTTNSAVAINSAITAYHQYLAPQTNLYNGSEYVDYSYTINEGDPFFETDQFSTGSVECDSVLYQDVPLLYDEVKGEVIIRDFYGRGKIKLNTENVAGFTLLQHHFVKLLPDSAGRSSMRPGFYDVLYQGNTGVYKREIKKVVESITVSLGLKRIIEQTDSYFFKKGNAFYEVSSKKSVLNVTKDRKREIQQFIKKQKLNIRNNKENALIQIAAYYDQLTKQ